MLYVLLVQYRVRTQVIFIAPCPSLFVDAERGEQPIPRPRRFSPPGATSKIKEKNICKMKSNAELMSLGES